MAKPKNHQWSKARKAFYNQRRVWRIFSSFENPELPSFINQAQMIQCSFPFSRHWPSRPLISHFWAKNNGKTYRRFDGWKNTVRNEMKRRYNYS